MVKYNRIYQFYAQVADLSTNVASDTLQISLPLTIEFDILRTSLGTSSNTGSFRIYNLSENHRNAVRFNIDNLNQFRSVVMMAGYDNSSTSGQALSTIFSGSMTQASSVREGINFITTIECLDAGFDFMNAQAAIVMPAGTTMAENYEALINTMAHTTVGAIGNFPTVNTRARSLNGSTVQLLNELTNNNFFVDNGKAHVLNQNEFISTGGVLTIDAAAGLLNTPQLEATNLHFDVIFEPRVHLGSQILLTSLTDKKFNDRLWTVTGIHHRGTISSSVAGDAVTSITCTYQPNPIPVESL